MRLFLYTAPPRLHDNYKSTCARALGVTQIVLGVLSIFAQIAALFAIEDVFLGAYGLYLNIFVSMELGE